MGIVYKHKNKINNKIYIGISLNNNLNIRTGKHGEGYSSNLVFTKDIIKYGWDNFSHEILYQDDTANEQSLCAIEKKYIKEYRSFLPEFGYNIDFGNPRSIMVKCKETNEIFFSCYEAEKSLGKNNYWGSVISKACKTGQPYGEHPETKLPLHWEYYKEYNNLDLQKELKKQLLFSKANNDINEEEIIKQKRLAEQKKAAEIKQIQDQISAFELQKINIDKQINELKLQINEIS